MREKEAQRALGSHKNYMTNQANFPPHKNSLGEILYYEKAGNIQF